LGQVMKLLYRKENPMTTGLPHFPNVLLTIPPPGFAMFKPSGECATHSTIGSQTMISIVGNPNRDDCTSLFRGLRGSA
jgi:hypothetical protein